MFCVFYIAYYMFSFNTIQYFNCLKIKRFFIDSTILFNLIML